MDKTLEAKLLAPWQKNSEYDREIDTYLEEGVLEDNSPILKDLPEILFVTSAAMPREILAKLEHFWARLNQEGRIIGKPVDIETAIKFYESSYSHGRREAALDLAYLYLHSTTKDNKQAPNFETLISYLVEALETNTLKLEDLNRARYLLGRLYLQYYKKQEALRLSNEASTSADRVLDRAIACLEAVNAPEYEEKANYCLGVAYLERANLEHSQEDLKRAQELLKKASAKGSPRATFLLALALFEGLYDEKRLKSAQKYFAKAAKFEEFREKSLNNIELINNIIKSQGTEAKLTNSSSFKEILASCHALDFEASATKFNDEEVSSEASPEELKSGFELIKEMADAGDIDQTLTLGLFYLNGSPGLCRRNTKKGLKYIALAAEKGNAEAMFVLGQRLCNEIQDPKPNHEGIAYLKKSAELGNTEAMEYLCLIYCNTSTSKEMFALGLEYGEKAVKAGRIETCDILINAYLLGKDDFLPNMEKAIEFMELSEALHDEDPDFYECLTQFYLEKADYDPDNAEFRIESEQEKRCLADKIIYNATKAAKLGSANAQHLLGKFYLDGLGVRESAELAKKWFTRAINSGCLDAYTGLGVSYTRGAEGFANYDKAFKVFSEGAKRHNQASMLMQGKCYRDGIGVDIDVAKAIKIFERLAKQKNDQAMLELGNIYYEGSLVKTDYTKAFSWYKKSVELSDNGELWFLLGNMYLKGLGTPADTQEAISCFKKAEDLGYISDSDMHSLFKDLELAFGESLI